MIAIRGATTVNVNTKEAILKETRGLLEQIIEKNEITNDQIISIIFTVTKDLDAVYPAVAARDLEITTAGLLCMQEMYVEGSLPKCIRILMHVSRDQLQEDVKHVYLNEAIHLRPDLSKKKSI